MVEAITWQYGLTEAAGGALYLWGVATIFNRRQRGTILEPLTKFEFGIRKWVSIGFALVYAALYSRIYPPLVLFPALAAIAYAIEHLSTLENTESRLENTSIDIKSIVNRMGTKAWNEKFVKALESGIPVLSVVTVWDTAPEMGTWLKDPLETSEQIVAMPESFFSSLVARYKRAPTVATTLIARAPLDSSHYLLDSGVPDQLNLLACIWQVTQIVKFNLRATRSSRVADIALGQWNQVGPFHVDRLLALKDNNKWKGDAKDLLLREINIDIPPYFVAPLPADV